MLTQTNKAGIRESLKQWSQRKKIPDEVLDDFIEISLSQANRALRIPPLEKSVTQDVDENGYFDLPATFLEAKQVSVIYNGNVIPLERKDISEVDHVFDRATGQPCIFGRHQSRIRIAPHGGVTEAYLYYYYALPPMPDDTTTNWFTLNAPELLLYGALAELTAYTRDDEGQARWQTKFNELINTIQRVEDRAAWEGSTLAVSLQGSR
jgi:hypothetical protein